MLTSQISKSNLFLYESCSCYPPVPWNSSKSLASFTEAWEYVLNTNGHPTTISIQIFSAVLLDLLQFDNFKKITNKAIIKNIEYLPSLFGLPKTVFKVNYVMWLQIPFHVQKTTSGFGSFLSFEPCWLISINKILPK